MGEIEKVDAAIQQAPKGIQFDMRGVAALTVVVAAIFGLGREWFDLGAVLALILGPAVLIFAAGSFRSQNRAALGAISVIVPLMSVLIGVLVQTLVWGVVYRITWVLAVFPAAATAVTIAMLWLVRSKRQLASVGILSFVVLLSLLAYRFQVTTAERWALDKFRGEEGDAGWVRQKFAFKLPAAYGRDLRGSEESNWYGLKSARVLLGLSHAQGLRIQQPLSRDEWIELGKLRDLEEISFLDCTFDLHFEPTNKLSQLKSLSFYNSTIRQCDTLANLRSLLFLRLSEESRVDNMSDLINQIVKLPMLRNFFASSNKISTADLQRLLQAKEAHHQASDSSWLEYFSVDAKQVEIETLVKWLRQSKGISNISGSVSIDNLELTEQQRIELQKRMDQMDDFVWE